MFVFGVLAFTAFAETRPRFDGLNVESINVVEKNGQLRAVIANTDRMPDPTGALALAALLTDKKRFDTQHVCCVISGGNVDPAIFHSLIA